MWVFFILGPLLCVVAAVLYARARAADNAHRVAAESEEMAKLAKYGTVTGTALGAYQLEARVDDVSVSVSAGVSRRVPGSTPSEGDDDGDMVRTVWIAKVIADLPARAILRSADAQRITPAEWAPTTTGWTRFDELYRIPADGSGRSTAYRGASDDGARWLTSTLAERFVNLNLQWLETKDGTAELAFQPLAPECVSAALVAAASVAKLARKEPEVPHAATRAVAPDSQVVIGSAPFMIKAAAIVTLLGAPFGGALAFLPPVRDAVAEACCGPGGTIEVTSSEDDEGTSYGLQCAGGAGGSAALAYMLAVCIWATFVMGTGVVLAARSWPARTRG